MTETPTRTRTDSIARSFNRIASHYDNPRLQALVYRRAQDAVVDELRVRESRRIVDVGCGTGLMTDRIARELSPDEVIGVDPSEGMLDQARSRSSRVRWIVGSAERLPLEDSSVDAVTSTTAFHFFDQPAALAEFARVLVPGGVVALATVDAAVASAPPVEWLLERSPLPARSTSGAALRNMLADAGFELDRQFTVRSCLTQLLWLHRISIGVR